MERRQMRTITTTEELAQFCTAAKSEAYVTIDTEFLRERTYWSKLCLIQLALPGKDGDAVLVDPIAGEAMSLEPLYVPSRALPTALPAMRAPTKVTLTSTPSRYPSKPLRPHESPTPCNAL